MSDPLVEEIVRQVLGELRSGNAAARDRGNGTSRSAAAESHASIREKVITEEVLENALAGDSADGMKRIIVAADAILTPSARDWLRIREIAWNRRPGANASVADATWMAVIVHSTGPLQQAIDEAVSKVGPWKKEVTDCPEQAVKIVIAELAAKQVTGAAVFTSSPAAVACGANRRREARAAVVASAACVQRVAPEMRANVFCIDAEGKSYFEVRGVLRAIAASNMGDRGPKWIS